MKTKSELYCQVCHELDVEGVAFVDWAGGQSFAICRDCLQQAIELLDRPQAVKGFLSLEGGAFSLELHPTDGDSEVVWVDKLESGDDDD